MNLFLEKRVYPNHSPVVLYEAMDRKKEHASLFWLEGCIETTAEDVTYRAVCEKGRSVLLRQKRPAGPGVAGKQCRDEEERLLEVCRFQADILHQAGQVVEKSEEPFCLYRDGEGWYWILYNITSGETLDVALKERAFSCTIKTLLTLAESTSRYHKAGWLMLNIRPVGILVTDHSGIRITRYLDFDSSIRIADLRSNRKETLQIPRMRSAYTAPELLEQIPNLREIGPAADYYSLGAILFEAVFNRTPDLYDCIPGIDSVALIAENTAWEKQTEEIRTQIIAFLTGTLTLSPETRFQSGNELTDALKRIADDCESFPETQQEKADSVHFEI